MYDFDRSDDSRYDPYEDLGPITEDDSDERIEWVVEQGRREYRDAWEEYLYQFYN